MSATATPPLGLEGRRALVTGAGSGIGAETAQLLVAVGARVVLADIDEQVRRVAEDFGAVAAVVGDVSLESDVERLVGAAAERLGGLDVAVNCAGIIDAPAPTVRQEAGTWQRIIDVNLRGTWLVCRAVGRVMLAQRHGVVTNVASIVGLGGFPRANAYGASKAGVVSLTRSLACEWGGSGVRVNCVAPGFVTTPMTARLAGQNRIDPERVEERTPLGRMGAPKEVASAIAFLSSDWASFISGALLCVDGGWSAFGGAGSVGRS